MPDWTNLEQLAPTTYTQFLAVYPVPFRQRREQRAQLHCRPRVRTRGTFSKLLIHPIILREVGVGPSIHNSIILYLPTAREK